MLCIVLQARSSASLCSLGTLRAALQQQWWSLTNSSTSTDAQSSDSLMASLRYHDSAGVQFHVRLLPGSRSSACACWLQIIDLALSETSPGVLGAVLFHDKQGDMLLVLTQAQLLQFTLH